MTQEHVPRPHPRQTSDAAQLTDRLQQLSSEEVERVLARAIELQSAHADAEPEAFDAFALQAVAAELGIDQEHLRTALVEELVRLETEAPDWLDRVVAPDRIVSYATLAGDRATIRQRLDAWLSEHEGLRRQAETPTGAAWDADRRMLTKVRMKLRGAAGDGSLRTARAVRDSVRPLMNERTLVTVEADTSNLRRLAVGLLVAGAAAGAGVAGVAGVVDPGGIGPEAVAAGVGTFGVLAGGVWIGVRMWADRIRRGLERTLHGITAPTEGRRSAGLMDLVDQVVNVVDDVRSSYRFRRM